MAKTRRVKKDDDTPRSFMRVMEFQNKLSDLHRKGPKSSESLPYKPRKDKSTSLSDPLPKLERKKGESMADFSRRVDQAIPLPRARGTDSRKTMTNTKKHKAKAENLRAEYKQRLEAKRRRIEDAAAENDDLSVEDDGEDIWAEVNAKSKRPKFGEVADRPPELPQLKQFSSVPKSAGSLARREILELERQKVISQYRKLRGTAIYTPEEE